MKDRKRILSVDPGTTIGCALWDEGELYSTIELKSASSDWFMHTLSLSELFSGYLQAHRPQRVYVEYPKLFESDGGKVSARSGSLVKLAFNVGMLVQCCWGENTSVKLVDVNEWKGQMSKELCQKRILKHLPSLKRSQLSDHVWDAIGIGLHVQGRTL